MKRVTRCCTSLTKRSLLASIGLLAAGAVEIAGFQRQLVHEARQEPRLLERRQVREMADFGIDVHAASAA